MAEDAVQIGPVSNPKFPANRENNREIRRYSACTRPATGCIWANSKTYERFPYSRYQGIVFDEQGSKIEVTGIF